MRWEPLVLPVHKAQNRVQKELMEPQRKGLGPSASWLFAMKNFLAPDRPLDQDRFPGYLKGLS